MNLRVRLASAYLRHFPVDLGKWQVWKRLRNTAVGEAGPLMTRTRDGALMRVRPDQYVEKFIYCWGQWEPNETRFVRRILRPGDGFLDVGAHVGYFSLLAAGCVGPTGQVIAVEATPDSARRLAENVALNDFANVESHNLAAAADDCCVTMGAHPKDAAMNAMRIAGSNTDTWEVAGKAMDDIVGSRALRLVKIDVEGAELIALRGMKNILARPEPPDLLVDITPEHLAAGDAGEIFSIMAAAGYRAHLLTAAGPRPVTPGAERAIKGTVHFTRR